MVSDLNIAKYVVKTFHEKEELITNLKLQKLLYYVQGWHLGLYDREILEEDFQAWVHGPVLPSIYYEYKHYKWNPISEEINDIFEIPDPIKKHINEVLEVYGMDTAWELERRTHLEDPWKLARGNLPLEAESTAKITKESMRSFFGEISS